MRLAAQFAMGLAALLVAPAPARAQEDRPLFRSDNLLHLTIQGPFASISSNRDSPVGRPAMLAMAGEQLRITLAPRGITRRKPEICHFPPLRVDFVPPPPAASLFAGQRRLKLVTHCGRHEPDQQYLLLEYAAYRMLNILTPLSFRARLARIDYRDGNGRPLTSRYGFFIEDIDDLARRNGLTRMQAGDRIAPSSLSHREAALGALFEYMIGNLDWSMRAGPRGEVCCHNFRLLAKAGSTKAVPVPYDFDFSGLVDAPYATPPAELSVASVRTRQYRGYCMHNEEALAAARLIRSRQAELGAAVTNVPGIAPRVAQRANAYLADFFRQIADDRTVQATILRRCVA